MNMENYKAKLFELLKQHSLPEEGISLWEAAFDKSAPQEQAVILEAIESYTAEEIKLLTDMFIEMKEAAQSNDPAKLEKIKEKKEEYFRSKTKEFETQIDEHMKKKHLFCLKKAEEAIK